MKIIQRKNKREKELNKFLKTIKMGDEVVFECRFGIITGTVIGKYANWPVIQSTEKAMATTLYFYSFKHIFLSISKTDKKHNILRKNNKSQGISFSLIKINKQIAEHKKQLRRFNRPIALEQLIM